MRMTFRALFLALAFPVCLAATSRAAPSISFTPAGISNTYAGNVTLRITGLSSGETVRVQKYLDITTNGVIDTNDWLMQDFRLTDGKAAMVIGGVTNVNVPYDTTATDGTITAQLNFLAPGQVGQQKCTGTYLYRVSSPTNHFSALTNAFVVSNSVYAQGITGKVQCNGTNVPFAYVMVKGRGNDDTPAGGVLANGSGSYTIPLATGTYQVKAVQTNCVYDENAMTDIVVSAGVFLTNNLSLIRAAQRLTGRVVDATSTNIGLPGLFVYAVSTNNLFSLCSTDSNGVFNLSVTTNGWNLSVDCESCQFYGYAGYAMGSGAQIDVTTNVSGVLLLLPKVTALVYGSMTNNLGSPLQGYLVKTYDESGYNYDSLGYTDTNGNYLVGVVGGVEDTSWHIGLADVEAASDYPFMLASSANWDIASIASNTAVQAGFTALPALQTISGSLKDNFGNAIADVEIDAVATVNGLSFPRWVYTDAVGAYLMNVGSGSWSVAVNAGTLPDQHGVPAGSSVSIVNSNATVNFVSTNLAITPGTYTYTTNSGTITLTGYVGAGGDMVIPGSIGNMPVAGIGPGAFAGLDGLTGIAIPATVTSIGDYAFNNCVNLADAAIPYAVTNIGVQAFANCGSLTAVTIPGGVVGIGDNAFDCCFGVQNIAISNGVARIGVGAFANSGLTAVTIPASVTNIGAGVFQTCYFLTNIAVAAANTAYSSTGGVLFTKSQGTLLRYPGGAGGSYYAIPSSVTNIGDNAFADCGSLAAVSLPSGVKIIGAFAFLNSGLTNIVIPAAVARIGDGAFLNSGLTNVTIPASVTNIGRAAFAAFSLANLSVASTNPAYSSAGGLLFNKNQTTLVQYPGGLTNATYVVPSTVTNIAEGAFCFVCDSLTNLTVVAGHGFLGSTNGVLFNKSLTTLIQYPLGLTADSYAVPAGVTNIGWGAFGMSQLLSVTIPNSVLTILDNAFIGSDLTQVTLPNSVISVGSNAFQNCGNLASASIPAGVTNLPDGVFQYCDQLVSVTFAGNAPRCATDVLDEAPATVYYLPGAIGWSPTFAGCPTALQATTCTLAVAASPTAGGAVSGGGSFMLGSSQTVTATPSNGYVFVNWTEKGGVVSSASSYTFTLLSNRTLVATFAVNPELVQNGGFETGTFSGWTHTGNSGSDFVNSYTGAVHSGAYVAGLGASGTLGYLAQTLPTITGQSYFVSFWLNILAGEIPNEFNMSWSGTMMFDRTNLVTVGWTNVQFVFTATNTLSTVRLGYRDDNSYFWLDDVSVQPCASFMQFVFVTNGACIAITGYRGAGGVLTIPGTINGFPVTSIAASAFSGVGSLTDMTIPGSVTNVGQNAFAACARLTNVFFLGNAPTVGSTAFGSPTVVYYLPGTSNWGSSFGGCSALLWNPSFTPASLSVQTNRFVFQISGTPNIPVLVQARTNLVAGTWTLLFTTNLTGGSIYYRDDHWTNNRARFYRIVAP